MKTINLGMFALSTAMLISCQKTLDADSMEKMHSVTSSSKKLTWTTTTFASGLAAPIGLARAANGYLWVTEAGTGNNDGRVSVIDHAGNRHTAFTGFATIVRPGEGPVGLNHLAIRGQMLYIINGSIGNLYMADISDWKPGDPPIAAANLPNQNISNFVLAAGKHESNIYNLTFGEDGDLFICDAAGNCIVRRSAEDGSLSIFAEFPPLANGADFVPTAIVRDGSNFYVSGLGGFPFIAGLSNIHRVNAQGQVSLFATGFTTLTDLEITQDKELLALQFANFVLAPPPNGGFQPMTGRITDINGNTLLSGLMFPTSLVRGAGGNCYYVVSRALGTIDKIE
jgi:hypothetical protein